MEPDDVTIDWHHELVDQLAFQWTHLRRRLGGLTDAEYFWEPVPGWSLRVGDDGSAALDRTSPEPDPPPFTTIAWRMCHLIGDVLGGRAHGHFDLRAFDPATRSWPTTATDALSMLDDAYDAWMEGVARLGNEGLRRRALPMEVGYHGPSMASLVLHINREVIHHGGEIACLRDLYRDSVATPRC